MRRGWTGSALLDNRGLKLVSLLIALVLWVRVVGSEQNEGNYKVGVVIVNLPKELVLLGNVPQNINVRMTGPRAVMSSLDEKKLNYTLDLTGMQEGATAFEILPSKLGLPRGVEVTQISPSKILLQSDRKVRKRLVVSPRISGTPAQGFSIVSAVVSPADVEVEGGERVLRVLREIPAELVDVSGLAGSLERTVVLSPSDPSIRVIEKTPIRLEVKIRELSGEQSYHHVAVAPPSPRWATRPTFVEVRLKGNLDVLSRLKSGDIEVRASHAGKAQPPGPVPLTVASPPGTIFVSANPAEVLLLPSSSASKGAGEEKEAGENEKEQETQQ